MAAMKDVFCRNMIAWHRSKRNVIGIFFSSFFSGRDESQSVSYVPYVSGTCVAQLNLSYFLTEAFDRGYPFNICFSPVLTDSFLTMYIWCCGLVTGIFLSSSGFFLLKVSRQDLCLIANDLMIWKLNSIFHVKTFPLQSTAKFSSPVS